MAMTRTSEQFPDSAFRLVTKAGKEARFLSSGAGTIDSHRLLATRLLLSAAIRTLPTGDHSYPTISRVLDALHDYLLLKAPSSVATGASDNLRLCGILRALGELSGEVAISIVKSADASGPPRDTEYRKPTIEDLIREIAADVTEAATGARA